VVLLPGTEGLTVRFSSAELAFDEGEIEAASWVFQKGQEAGCGTEIFSGSRIRYRPLKTGDGIIGVMGIQSTGSRDLLLIDQSDLLGVFMSQAALAITRADLATKAKRAEVLQEADKLQKALLNSVSHNLRTPLSSILGVLNTILEDGTLLDMPTQRNLLGTAQHEARRLDWLVQNLLDMTRLEGGAIRMKTELCDVNDIAAGALRQLSEDQGKRISVTTAPNLPLVPLDDVLIVQVLVNMLDNALKYSPADAPVEVQARLAAGQLEIRVLDRGRGIPEQELERVFEKFHRVTVPGAPNGAGLGLSICKGFVEAHGGRILAERRPQGGTELVFFLPLEAKT